MTKNRFKWSAITAAVVAASFASSVALAAQNEVECNNPAVDAMGNIALNPATNSPYAQEQKFDTSGVAMLDGAIMSGTTRNSCTTTSAGRDLDFYRFTAKAGDDINVAILNAYEQTGTIMDLALFGPYNGQPRQILNQNYFNTGTITDTAGLMDPSFNYKVLEDGTYYVGISTYPTWFYTMGYLSNLTTYYPQSAAFPTIGSYTLRVSGVKPSVLTIGMEIRPGSHNVTVVDASGSQPSGIRGKAKGSIPVALLSSAKDHFDATKVQQSSLYFGKTGKEDTFVSCNGGHGTDVNGDGLPDLICHFDLSNAGFGPLDNQAFITGKTGDGKDFQGQAWMKIMVKGLRPQDLVHGKK